MRRLLAEHRSIGTNVRSELQQRGLRPWSPSPDLNEFYRTTSAFLYESAVWNRFPAKQQMRAWTSKYLSRAHQPSRRVLVFGDGPGFDSCHFASRGHAVVVIEPSAVQRRFAADSVREMNSGVRIEPELSAVEDQVFDAIVCLDVLEHLEEPEAVVAALCKRLIADGVLIVHAPFYLVDTKRPTHLWRNRRHSGSLSLFRRAGLEPVDGQLFWNPIVLSRNVAGRQWTALARIQAGRVILAPGRRTRLLGKAADLLARRPSQWIAELETMSSEVESSIGLGVEKPPAGAHSEVMEQTKASGVLDPSALCLRDGQGDLGV